MECGELASFLYYHPTLESQTSNATTSRKKRNNKEKKRPILKANKALGYSTRARGEVQYLL